MQRHVAKGGDPHENQNKTGLPRSLGRPCAPQKGRGARRVRAESQDRVQKIYGEFH